MNGFEVLEAVRRDPSIQKVSVMMLTACDDALDVMRGSELHADDYLGKPVSPIILLKRVKQLPSASRGNTRRWTRVGSDGAGSGARLARRWIVIDGSSSQAVEKS
jgi:DNA-binding response OmpR family regulator